MIVLTATLWFRGTAAGGEAAYFFAEKLLDLYTSISKKGRVLRSIVALAPRSKTEDESPNDDVFTSPVPGDLTRPYLILQGANDDDVKSDSTRAFEIYGDEESTELPTHDKFLLWAHDVAHNEWGGVPGQPSAKAGAIESLYIPAFLKWQILASGDPLDRQLFTDLVHYERDSITLDTSLNGSGFWDDCDPEFDDLLETPVIFGDLTLGLKGDPDARIQIDTMQRPSLTACVSSISPSSSGEGVTVSGLMTSQTCMGSTQSLIQPLPVVTNLFVHPHQAASAIRVQWGDTQPGGAIEWTLEEDLTDHSFLSLRVGQIYDPSFESLVTLGVGLVTGTAQGAQIFKVNVDIYTQDDAPADSFAPPTRHVADFVRTVRIPLSDFCALGADITDVKGIVIEFPSENTPRSILLDSLEFTKNFDSSDLGSCP